MQTKSSPLLTMSDTKLVFLLLAAAGIGAGIALAGNYIYREYWQTKDTEVSESPTPCPTYARTGHRGAWSF